MVLGFFTNEAEVGLFGVVMRVAMLLHLIVVVVNSIFLPRISVASERGDTSALWAEYSSCRKYHVLFSILPCLVVVIFSEEILALFGSEFSRGVVALQIVACVNLITSFVGPSDEALVAQGFSKAYLKISLVVLFVSAVSAIFFSWRWGILGAAFVAGASLLLLRVVSLSYMKRCNLNVARVY